MREGLKNFFLLRGWDLGEEYGEVGGSEELEHTYLSFAYDEVKGVNVTMYYSPFMNLGRGARSGG